MVAGNPANIALARRFSLLHPAVTLVFFAGVLLLTLLSYHPAILLLSLVCAALNVCLYLGPARLLATSKWLLPMMLIVVLFNLLLNRRGATELFALGNHSFTSESLTFGIAIALMLAAVMLWFLLYQQFMTSDRFLYLFAPLAPTTALTISMVQRWIPLTKYRFEQIRSAQKMGGESDQRFTTLGDQSDQREPAAATTSWYRCGRKIRLLLRCLSALMSWSMEDAIQAADSMQARGYGSKDAAQRPAKRSSFRSYRLTTGDRLILAALIVLVVVAALTLFVTTRDLAFFPIFRGAQQLSHFALVASALLMSFPLLVEGGQYLRCLQSASKN
ncbi:MAG: energy-coupling factor transporter transmembrane protein EcfT [Coriobacteriia bacterium]|nr:energy-coupling factor transporter transmembrane protein EcfT [Coriobacteriia bacterium]